jgi:ATP-binding cassette subfamily G (WHITE) protein 2
MFDTVRGAGASLGGLLYSGLRCSQLPAMAAPPQGAYPAPPLHLTPRFTSQVSLLSCGRLMYSGICDGLVEWFRTIGFDYDANLHGVVSDWALDLVAVGSHKPKKFYGNTITTKDEVRTVAAQFLARWMDLRGLAMEDLSMGGGSTGGALVSVRKRGAGARGVGRGGAAAAAAALAVSGGGAGPSGSAPDALTLKQIAAIGGSAGEEATVAAARPSSWVQQYWWTLRRELIMITRNPADVAGRTLTNTWVATTMGLMYYDLTNDSGALKCKVNMLLNILAFFCLMPYISMSLYTAGKQFYLADVSAKLYTPSAYYLAKVGPWARGAVGLGAQTA